MTRGLLTAVTFLPLVGAVVLLAAPREATRAIRLVGLGVTVAVFALSVPLYLGFDGGRPVVPQASSLEPHA